MEVLKDDFTISSTSRHEQIPAIEYNPLNNDFILLWHTSGPTSDCAGPDLWSIDGQRVSSEGELLGDPINISPTEEDSPNIYAKLAHNIFTNQYLVAFTKWQGEETEGGPTRMRSSP